MTFLFGAIIYIIYSIVSCILWGKSIYNVPSIVNKILLIFTMFSFVWWMFVLEFGDESGKGIWFVIKEMWNYV